MLNTKDVTGFMKPFAGLARHLWAVSIPGQKATLPASRNGPAAPAAGIEATEADMSGRRSPPSRHRAPRPAS
jgi:dihydrofolate synthase/folylpolyglutamate synthase